MERLPDPGRRRTRQRGNQWHAFSELIDRQDGEKDLSGQLAFQLHSGAHTKIEFRSVRLRELKPGDLEVKFKTHSKPKATTSENSKAAGVLPKADDGRRLNLGFEDGTLRDWTISGAAFKGQPVKRDGIASRWSGQTSGKDGEWFIAGFELAKDRPGEERFTHRSCFEKNASWHISAWARVVTGGKGRTVL